MDDSPVIAVDFENDRRLEPDTSRSSWRSIPHQSELSYDAKQLVLKRHADHPSGFLVLNSEMQYFTLPECQGMTAYRDSGGWRFQLGGVFSRPEDRSSLLEAFLRQAKLDRKRVCVVQLRADQIGLYRAAGFRFNQFGRSYTLELKDWSLAGTRYMKLRNKLKQASRAGVEVFDARTLGWSADELLRRLERVTAQWLRAKGRHVSLVEFLVGQIESVRKADVRCFVALQGAEVVGFVTYVPCYGRRPGYLHDLSRRIPGTVPGVMESINVAAIREFQARGIPHVSFGFTPFLGLEDELDGHSKVLSWLMNQLAIHGHAIYPAKSQGAYKKKWKPQVIEPEYIGYQGRLRAGCILQLLRVTRSI